MANLRLRPVARVTTAESQYKEQSWHRNLRSKRKSYRSLIKKAKAGFKVDPEDLCRAIEALEGHHGSQSGFEGMQCLPCLDVEAWRCMHRKCRMADLNSTPTALGEPAHNKGNLLKCKRCCEHKSLCFPMTHRDYQASKHKADANNTGKGNGKGKRKTASNDQMGKGRWNQPNGKGNTKGSGSKSDTAGGVGGKGEVKQMKNAITTLSNNVEVLMKTYAQTAAPPTPPPVNSNSAQSKTPPNPNGDLKTDPKSDSKLNGTEPAAMDRKSILQTMVVPIVESDAYHYRAKTLRKDKHFLKKHYAIALKDTKASEGGRLWYTTEGSVT